MNEEAQEIFTRQLLETSPSLSEAELEGGWSFFDIGSDLVGGAEINLNLKRGEAFINLLAWKKNSGKVVFHGGMTYEKEGGILILGPPLASFVRAKEYRGRLIGMKMTLVGLNVAQAFIEGKNFPIRQIFAQTQHPKMVGYLNELGFKAVNEAGGYSTTSFPNLSPLLEKYQIRELPNSNNQIKLKKP